MATLSGGAWILARRGTINLLLGFGGDFSGVLPRDPESISASKGKAPNGTVVTVTSPERVEGQKC